MENFRNVLVWRRALRLAVRVAHATRELPRYEREELGMQMRKSARSVHANIAEACGRKVAGRSNADPLRVLVHASGELHELDSDVEYARDAGYWPPELANPMLAEISQVRRMLGAFITYRRNHEPPSRRKDRRKPRLRHQSRESRTGRAPDVEERQALGELNDSNDVNDLEDSENWEHSEELDER